MLSAVLGLLRREASSLDAVDVGAGTGLWTHMLAGVGFRSVTAVEPNAAMRAAGQRDDGGHDIVWRDGTGEATGLADGSADLLTMASSFHWVDFDSATAEFRRVLRPGGWFVALWNPRLVERNPLLAEIEAELLRMKPDLRRVSSGRSGITETLTDRLNQHPGFDDVVTIESRHVVRQSVEHYLGAWRSVNDVRVQLGEVDFGRFLEYVRDRLADADEVEATYLSRAWAARRRD
ncbi:class I SAM-dependent methyltransferase [Plantactinospora sp. KLBMP9567]|nr:class I SAM-dependent methyltransferase [Plantactinospora sp. KLBMP9567]MDW5326756.1 class I SAM-dependent methyltransferase [Plantactinospora sp. KLBMP9567]